jgi:hypothetical protein
MDKRIKHFIDTFQEGGPFDEKKKFTLVGKFKLSDHTYIIFHQNNSTTIEHHDGLYTYHYFIDTLYSLEELKQSFKILNQKGGN